VGWIGERPQQIKNRAQAQFASGGLYILHCGVHRRSKKKRNSDFLQTGSDPIGRQADVDAQRFHYVSRTAFGSHAAVSVLGHAHARARDHKSSSGRNIEGAAGVAASAASIHQGIASGAADVYRMIRTQAQWNCSCADGLRETNDLLNRLALHMERDQQGCNLGIGALAGQNLGHYRPRLFAGERLAMISYAMECVDDHWLVTLTDH